MRRILPLLLLLPIAAAGDDRPVAFRDKLAKIRSMSPRQRAMLRKNLEVFRKLSPEEQQRLRENLVRVRSMPEAEVRRLRERVRNLDPADRRNYRGLASGFFKWGRHRQLMRGFPRGLFFTWLRRNHPEELKRLHSMEASVPGPRVDSFIKLYHQFRVHALGRLANHARRHGCIDVERVARLRRLSPIELWPRYHELVRSCSTRPRK